jgi:hypothetical protein
LVKLINYLNPKVRLFIELYLWITQSFEARVDFV